MFRVVSRAEAVVLGNRELFGRLAAGAMLVLMKQAFSDFDPQLILRGRAITPRDSASWGPRRDSAGGDISGRSRSRVRSPRQLPPPEERRKGVVDELFASPYMTYFPASLDPSPFATTLRFRHGVPASPRPLPPSWEQAISLLSM